jgi:X-X-X-Leu-X-X-Gly heptad repeat protein
LVQASSQLKTASNQLAQGSDALVDGLTLFKSKGLDKISSVLNDTVKKDVDTTQELVDLANDYKTFADSKDGVEAKTKFIMIIDSKSKK